MFLRREGGREGGSRVKTYDRYVGHCLTLESGLVTKVVLSNLNCPPPRRHIFEMLFVFFFNVLSFVPTATDYGSTARSRFGLIKQINEGIFNLPVR